MEAYKNANHDDSREDQPDKDANQGVRLSVNSQDAIETHLLGEVSLGSINSISPNFLRRRTPRFSASSSLSPYQEEPSATTTTEDIKVAFTESSPTDESKKNSLMKYFFGGETNKYTTSVEETESEEPEIDLSGGYIPTRNADASTETHIDEQSPSSSSVQSGLTEPTKSFPMKEGVPRPPPSVSSTSSSLEMVNSTQSPGIRSMFQAPHRPPTKLHELCSEAKTVDDLMQARSVLLKLNIPRKKILNFAGVRDGKGKNPMHLISENIHISEDLFNITQAEDDLSLFPDIHPQATTLLDNARSREMVVETFVADFLLAASPTAAMSRDNNGRIPFEQIITEWVNQYHDEMIHSKSFRSKRDNFASAPLLVMNALRFSTSKGPRTKSANNVDGKTTVMKSPDVERGMSRRPRGLNTTPSKNVQSKELRRSKCFPVNVNLSNPVSLALKLLSKIIERLEKLSSESRSASKKLVPSKSKTPNALKEADSFDRIFHESTTGACAYGDIQDAIISNIASIPDFVKLMLLIDDDEEREDILSSTIMRRVLISKHSVGTWLTAMIQSGNKRVSSRAIEYLKIVSDITAVDSPSSKKGESSSSLSGMERHRDELTTEISHLKGFVPSLLALGERGVEEAATSMVTRRVMDRIISRPFSILFIVCDAVFLVMLIAGFRSAVNNLLVRGNPSVVMRGLYTANTGIFYFIIRELGKAISLCMVTRSPRMYIWSFWNLTDLTATILAFISILSIRSISRSEEGLDIIDMHPMRNLLAITTGFLWLRVLNLLKGINMQMATFILAILQITKDTLSFGIILLTMVITFAQMFYTVLIPDYCSEETPGDDPEYRCKQSEYIFRVYTILLGDFSTFEREHFKTQFALILLIFYSFMVIIVLLNVLIAVASDSYEKCLLKSQMLFGRARVMLIAELVCFQSLLHKNPDNGESIQLRNSKGFDKWWNSAERVSGWSSGSLAFFCLSSLVILLWAVGEMAGSFSGERHGSVAFSLLSILINIIVFSGMMVFLSQGADNFVSKRGDLFETNSIDTEGSWLPSCLQKCMLRVMGSSQDSRSFGERGKNGDEWLGRVHHIQSKIDELGLKQAQESLKQAQELEQLVAASELRLKTEMVALDQRVESMSTCLLVELRQLHEATTSQIQSALANRHRSGEHED